jgi:hypothetical protein
MCFVSGANPMLITFCCSRVASYLWFKIFGLFSGAKSVLLFYGAAGSIAYILAFLFCDF